MARQKLIERDEVVAALFRLNDVNANLERIRELLEEELGGEEEVEEDPS